jgi:hypothetical protein
MMPCPLPLSLWSLYHTRKRLARKKNTSVIDCIKFMVPLNIFRIDVLLSNDYRDNYMSDKGGKWKIENIRVTLMPTNVKKF